MLKELQHATQTVGLEINDRKGEMMTNLMLSDSITLKNIEIEIVDK